MYRLLIAAVIVGLARAGSYETTTTFNADAYVVPGSVSGQQYGQVQHESSHSYDGSSQGQSALYDEDERTARQEEELAKGYEYEYSQGHSLEDGRQLYNYQTEEPIFNQDFRFEVPEVPGAGQYDDLMYLRPDAGDLYSSVNVDDLIRALQLTLDGVHNRGGVETRVLQASPTNFGYANTDLTNIGTSVGGSSGGGGARFVG